MSRALPLVATLIAIGTAWSAEPAPGPVRPLDWRPIPAPTGSTPAPATTPAPAETPAPDYRAPTTRPAPKAESDANARYFTPFNGIVIEPRVISTYNGETVAGAAWNLDFSLLHNRVTALARGLPESDAYRSVDKTKLDFDVQVEGFGQSVADPDQNPADHETARLVASAGYGFVGATGSANRFSDDASSIYFDLGVGAGIETNQSLTSTQVVAGARLVITPSLAADNADLNVFDWIPRIGRFLSGDEWADNGSGRALPVITIGLDNVSADGNDLRDRIAPDDTSYLRLHIGATGRAPIWRLPRSEQYVYGTAAVDVYQELSAPSEISDREIDSLESISLGVELPGNVAVGVTRGELPMDPGRKTYWTIGWKFTF